MMWLIGIPFFFVGGGFSLLWVEHYDQQNTRINPDRQFGRRIVKFLTILAFLVGGSLAAFVAVICAESSYHVSPTVLLLILFFVACWAAEKSFEKVHSELKEIRETQARNFQYIDQEIQTLKTHIGLVYQEMARRETKNP